MFVGFYDCAVVNEPWESPSQICLHLRGSPQPIIIICIPFSTFICIKIQLLQCHKRLTLNCRFKTSKNVNIGLIRRRCRRKLKPSAGIYRAMLRMAELQLEQKTWVRILTDIFFYLFCSNNRNYSTESKVHTEAFPPMNTRWRTYKYTTAAIRHNHQRFIRSIILKCKFVISKNILLQEVSHLVELVKMFRVFDCFFSKKLKMQRLKLIRIKSMWFICIY